MPNRTDSIISHGKGVAKGIRARLSGLVGVFKTLAEQHGEVSALMERAKASHEKRADLWPKIRRELISHERAELREIYPALREHAETRALAERHDVEASDLEQRITRLDEMAVDSDAWGNAFAQLADAVLAHATEEEKTIFPAAQRALGDDRARQLEQPFLATKKRIAEGL